VFFSTSQVFSSPDMSSTSSLFSAIISSAPSTVAHAIVDASPLSIATFMAGVSFVRRTAYSYILFAY
jgi:hypothetical protein